MFSANGENINNAQTLNSTWRKRHANAEATDQNHDVTLCRSRFSFMKTKTHRWNPNSPADPAQTNNAQTRWGDTAAGSTGHRTPHSRKHRATALAQVARRKFTCYLFRSLCFFFTLHTRTFFSLNRSLSARQKIVPVAGVIDADLKFSSEIVAVNISRVTEKTLSVSTSPLKTNLILLYDD